ncbi:MAG: tetratricopeptide repeat protein [Burkholderiales bacterium]
MAPAAPPAGPDRAEAAGTAAEAMLRAFAAAGRGAAAEAEALCHAALAADPGHFEAQFLLGTLAGQAGRMAESARLLAHAVARHGGSANAHNNLGNALQALNRLDEALASYDRALALNAEHGDAHYNRGIVLAALRRNDEALASYERALTLRPESADAHANRGLVLRELGRHADAVAAFDRAIVLQPAHAGAHVNRGLVLREMKRLPEALASLARGLALDPAHPFVFGEWLHTRMQMCDWAGIDRDFARLAAGIAHGEPICAPFTVLATPVPTSLQALAAQAWTRARFPPDTTFPAIARRPRRDRIRVAYVSPDFREHPVGRLVVAALEAHDRARFEVTAIAIGRADGGDVQRRVMRAADRYVDARALGDREVAQRARELGVDIAIDLAGYTTDSRPGIFALRAAPVQASYLGYLGTMGAPYIDYLIADRVTIPDADRPRYAERIVRLPAYFPDDVTRRPAERAPTREACGLPASGFVFCCFNNSYKLLPETLDRWTAILRGVPGAVLFLYAENAWAQANLRREFAARGIGPQRLVFAAWQPHGDYLARYAVADLFLDTHPYNAGTTASDALWAGLPVLTYAGDTFAGRVAASLLVAAGVPELVAATPAAYVASAIDLASRPDRLHALRQRLAGRRVAAPAGPPAAHTRWLESAYEAMHARWQAGLAPDHIEIAR